MQQVCEPVGREATSALGADGVGCSYEESDVSGDAVGRCVLFCECIRGVMVKLVTQSHSLWNCVLWLRQAGNSSFH